MVTSKIILALLNIIGIPLYVYTLYINMDNWKGSVLFGVIIFAAIVRLYFYARQKSNALIRERQERVLKDIEIARKHQEKREKDIELMERELSVLVTGLTEADRKKRLNG